MQRRLTKRNLEVLERIDGFPKLGQTTARKLVELREEFPDLDPVAVCRNYETWTLDNPKATKNRLSRLRTFFVNAQKWSGLSPTTVDVRDYGPGYERF